MSLGDIFDEAHRNVLGHKSGRFEGQDGRRYAIAWFTDHGRAYRGSKNYEASPKVCRVVPRDLRDPKRWIGSRERLVPLPWVPLTSPAIADFLSDVGSWAPEFAAQDVAVAARRAQALQAGLDARLIQASVARDLQRQDPGQVLQSLADSPGSRPGGRTPPPPPAAAPAL